MRGEGEGKGHAAAMPNPKALWTASKVALTINTKLATEEAAAADAADDGSGDDQVREEGGRSHRIPHRKIYSCMHTFAMGNTVNCFQYICAQSAFVFTVTKCLPRLRRALARAVCLCREVVPHRVPAREEVQQAGGARAAPRASLVFLAKKRYEPVAAPHHPRPQHQGRQGLIH